MLYIILKRSLAYWQWKAHTQVSNGSLKPSHDIPLLTIGSWRDPYDGLLSLGSIIPYVQQKNMWVSKKVQVGVTPKWMMNIMENPMNKWMIWGVFTHYFWKHPNNNQHEDDCILQTFPYNDSGTPKSSLQKKNRVLVTALQWYHLPTPSHSWQLQLVCNGTSSRSLVFRGR